MPGANNSNIDVLGLCGTAVQIRDAESYSIFFCLHLPSSTCAEAGPLSLRFSHLIYGEQGYIDIGILDTCMPLQLIALRMYVAFTKRSASHTPAYFQVCGIPGSVDRECPLPRNEAVIV